MTPFLFALMIAAGEPQAAPPPPPPQPQSMAPAETETSEDEAEAQTPRLTGVRPAEAAPPPPAVGYYASSSAPMATLETRPIVRPFEMPAYSPVGPMSYAAPGAPVAA